MKKIIALGIIAASLTTGVLIIGLQNDSSEIAVKEKSSEVLSDHADNHIGDSLAIPDSLSGSKNITRDLSEKIGKEIIARNPDGPSLIDNDEWVKALDPEEVINKLLADDIENFNYKDLIPSINLNELKVAGESNSQLTEHYLENFKSILENNFQDLSFNWKNPDYKDFNGLITAYEKAIVEFYQLPVPKNLAPIHQKEIALLKAQKTIFENIKNYQSDPVLALLSIQANGQIDQEFARLKKELLSY